MPGKASNITRLHRTRESEFRALHDLNHELDKGDALRSRQTLHLAGPAQLLRTIVLLVSVDQGVP